MSLLLARQGSSPPVNAQATLAAPAVAFVNTVLVLQSPGTDLYPDGSFYPGSYTVQPNAPKVSVTTSVTSRAAVAWGSASRSSLTSGASVTVRTGGAFAASRAPTRSSAASATASAARAFASAPPPTATVGSSASASLTRPASAWGSARASASSTASVTQSRAAVAFAAAEKVSVSAGASAAPSTATAWGAARSPSLTAGQSVQSPTVRAFAAAAAPTASISQQQPTDVSVTAATATAFVTSNAPFFATQNNVSVGGRAGKVRPRRSPPLVVPYIPPHAQVQGLPLLPVGVFAMASPPLIEAVSAWEEEEQEVELLLALA